MLRISYQRLTEYLVENQEKFYRLAYSYLLNREDASDAVQNAVCKALEKFQNIRNAEALKAWFYRILVNECYDRLRARGRMQFYSPEELDLGSYEDPTPQDDSLQKKVDLLPAEIQTIIRLRFYEEFSLKEISEVTGCNINTIKTRLYTGLKKLRVTMEGEDAYE